jgi:signal peptidase complex subunit 2
MAKKKSKSSEATTAEAVAVADAASHTAPIQGFVEDELELLQVDLGDIIKIKQVLDESVSAAVLEHVKEDYRWDNCKLWIMFLACACAMIAQFAPIPFPESRVVLGLCGSIYFILSGVLQFITSFIDKDSILLTKPIAADDARTKQNPKMAKYGLKVRSGLPRFSEWYTVIIEFEKVKNIDSAASSDQVKQKWSVGQFFDKEGYFDEVGLSKEIDNLVERFEACQYNSLNDKTKTA